VFHTFLTISINYLTINSSHACLLSCNCI